MTGTATEGWGPRYLAVAPHGFATSHIDALCHVFHDGKLYNGYTAEMVTAHGATRLGIHHLRVGVVSRGVLLDIPALRGVDALEPGEPVYPEDLEAAEARAGLAVRTGRRAGGAHRALHGRRAHGLEPRPWRQVSMPRACPGCASADVAALGSDGVSDVVPSRVDGVACRSTPS